MRIQHNIAALNSHRQLGGNNNAVGKNLEKLSSGYKINRAGDDAAGLAISEKMRAQIKGLETASKNANDGISLIQTAEGALTEVHSMLNRMVELSTQSSNGTYGVAERQKLSDETDQLKEEIDRISQGTNFNGINLLDGSLGSKGTSGTGGATNGDGMALVAGAGALTDVGGAKGEYSYKIKIADKTMADNGGMKFKFKLTDNSEVDIEVKLTKDMTVAGVNAAIKGAIEGNDQLKGKFDVAVNDVTGDITFKALSEGAGTLGIKEVTQTFHNVVAGTGELNTTALAQGGMEAVFGTGTTIAVDDTPKAAMVDVVGKDAYKKISFGGTNANLMGQSVTIGDKTYEFTSADKIYGIKEGSTGIVLGADKAETMKNLVAALKKDGVTSAEVDNDGIKIGNADQIKSTKGYGISTDSVSGVKLGGNTAIDGVFKVNTDGTGTVTTTAITINYKDKDGKDQSSILNIDLTGKVTEDAKNQVIIDAINNDKVLKDLFDAKVDTGAGLIITAKNNKDGAKVTSMSSDKAGVIGANANDVVAGAEDVKAFGAGQTIGLSNAGIKAGDTLTIDGKTFEFVNDADGLKNVKDGNIAIIKGATDTDTAKNLAAALKGAGMESKINTAGEVLIEYDGAAISGSNGLKLQVGDTNEDFQKVTVQIDSMSAKSLGLDKVNVFDQDKAGDSMEIIKAAIEKVSTARGNLGALQNRLDHTINNLGVTTENMTAAESRIRDVDMAKEMMDFTKNNILTQAAQSMLAQANQLPQGVLQLLQ